MTRTIFETQAYKLIGSQSGATVALIRRADRAAVIFAGSEAESWQRALGIIVVRGGDNLGASAVAFDAVCALPSVQRRFAPDAGMAAISIIRA